MARYLGPVCKVCRREGMKLFLKGERCYSKCPIDKDKGALPPGQHAHRRAGKPTEYGKRLREKQKARHISGVFERQFQRYFTVAATHKGNTGENLLRILETRLDNVVRRLGFSMSLANARQLVRHGHVQVNGRRVSIPSYQTKPGDHIVLDASFQGNILVKKCLQQTVQKGLPAWLELDGKLVEAVKRSQDSVSLEGLSLTGSVKAWPARQEMSYPVNEQFIVELYSK